MKIEKIFEWIKMKTKKILEWIKKNIKINKVWEWIKKNTKIVLSAGAALIGALGLLTLKRKKNTQEKVDSGKKIGGSEKKDKDRADVIERADEQSKKNEEVIKRSKDAIEKAKELKNEDNS